MTFQRRLEKRIGVVASVLGATVKRGSMWRAGRHAFHTMLAMREWEARVTLTRRAVVHAAVA